MRSTILYVLLLLAAGHPALRGQGLAGAKNLDPAVTVHLGYGPFASAGDLADRFGSGWAIDGGVSFVPANGGWEFGGKVQYGFGSEVKEDVLASLRTRDGFLIGNQREPAAVQLRQRQLFVGASIGYTLRVGKNQRAGMLLRTSPGYFFHRIRLQDDPIQAVAPLAEELKAGYDRLTGGFAIHQFVGYQQLATDRRLNFYVGAETTVGFTRALRSFDVPTGGPPPAAGRTDVLLGLKAGLLIPFYFGEGREIFYR